MKISKYQTKKQNNLFWPFFLHFVLKASKLERRLYFPQPSTLPSLEEGLGGGCQSPSLGERLRVGELRSGMRSGVGIMSFCPSVRYDVGILSFCQVYAPNGALICQPRATPGELDVAGIRPEDYVRVVLSRLDLYRVSTHRSDRA